MSHTVMMTRLSRAKEPPSRGEGCLDAVANEKFLSASRVEPSN